jgi:alpha-2-macroglobulin
VTVREGKVDASNVFTFNRLIDIPADQLRDGDNSVTVTMDGSGALYMAAYAKYFTLEEPITKAGNEIFVTRKYFIQSVKETLMKGYTNDWKELKDGQAVNSGDRIRVDVTMEAKNHYEYLVAEDYKPAGLEAIELKSGPGYAVTLDREGRETGEQTPLYQEFRDQKAAFFISKLKQGKHLFRYELRAEIPGKFHAMPNQSHAMYVPEIRASSDEMRIDVNEAPAEKGSVKD